jgi:hypothetical protein
MIVAAHNDRQFTCSSGFDQQNSAKTRISSGVHGAPQHGA